MAIYTPHKHIVANVESITSMSLEGLEVAKRPFFHYEDANKDQFQHAVKVLLDSLFVADKKPRPVLSTTAACELASHALLPVPGICPAATRVTLHAQEDSAGIGVTVSLADVSTLNVYMIFSVSTHNERRTGHCTFGWLIRERASGRSHTIDYCLQREQDFISSVAEALTQEYWQLWREASHS